ncbi:MAG TPA: bifunctional 4-hydroxy-2-oxoglutarate aldolase/2-dehydro-3-deoxy-phosphogluconate aldolase [Chloroflexia bacterium]|nr:bifunctional 4-hydroxy-2-oxoglutarate aldolase/2-dehydro-3-deoxy-phosphogluconate aldolase [Chloroflexia bacterium]
MQSFSRQATQNVLEITGQGGVVAIVRLPDLSQAIALSRALLDGGITALEFTLTNSDALKAMAEVKSTLAEFRQGKAVIGAGTVLNPEQASASIEAGAEFIVSPSTNFETIKLCRERGVAVMPGALTPTEIVKAWEAGADVIKVFPARSFGPAYFKDLREPLPHLKLMPTGGVNLENVAEYIRNGAVAVGVGGNLVDKKLVEAQDWEAIRRKAASYVEAVAAARLK